MRKLYKHISLISWKSLSICADERKRSSRRTALTGLRLVPSVTVFSKLNDKIDSDFLQIFLFAFHYDICK